MMETITKVMRKCRCWMVMACATIAGAAENPPELGDVTWYKDFQVATAKAQSSNRPILLLFQEIPGCETCKNFGAEPLSHPLLVEAMEDLFIPAVIYNNRRGVDAEVLARFKEPSWNNPVIRYLNSSHEDIIERQDRVWSVGDTARRMAAALGAAGKHVPKYLQLVVDEHGGKSDTAILAMHCYWEGEGQLGTLPGVKNTHSAWLRGKEVVEVTFDPNIADLKSLVNLASQVKCVSEVITTNERQTKLLQDAGGIASSALEPGEKLTSAKESDQRYYLKQNAMQYLPLTALQATRINSALRLKKDAEIYLSPRQKTLLTRIKEVLQKSPAQLDGMAFPDSSAAMADYQDRLQSKLE